jgi:hypothetical protein
LILMLQKSISRVWVSMILFLIFSLLPIPHIIRHVIIRHKLATFCLLPSPFSKCNYILCWPWAKCSFW